jgi:hypothetical protein
MIRQGISCNNNGASRPEFSCAEDAKGKSKRKREFSGLLKGLSLILKGSPHLYFPYQQDDVGTFL